MWLKFTLCNKHVQLNAQQLKHFPTLQSIQQINKDDCSTRETAAELDRIEAAIFDDLLQLYTDAKFCDTLQQKVVSGQTEGYLRDIFVLHCFLGNQTAAVEKHFAFLFEQVLCHANDDQLRHILGV